jgi:hypothetical protein
MIYIHHSISPGVLSLWYYENLGKSRKKFCSVVNKGLTRFCLTFEKSHVKVVDAGENLAHLPFTMAIA